MIWFKQSCFQTRWVDSMLLSCCVDIWVIYLISVCVCFFFSVMSYVLYVSLFLPFHFSPMHWLQSFVDQCLEVSCQSFSSSLSTLNILMGQSILSFNDMHLSFSFIYLLILLFWTTSMVNHFESNFSISLLYLVFKHHFFYLILLFHDVHFYFNNRSKWVSLLFHLLIDFRFQLTLK